MILSYQNNKYRISYGGLNLVENAYGNPDLVQVSIVAGTTVQVAPDDHFGIHYRANGEYATWKLDGVNTRIARAAKHYIYARLSRSEDTALLVFSVNRYRVDGKELGPDEEMWPSFTESKKPAPQPGEGGKSVSSQQTDGTEEPVLAGPYYYICIGEITESNETATRLREITIDAGYLTTPQGSAQESPFFRVIAGDLLQPLKDFASFLVRGTVSIMGALNLNGKEVNDIARSTDEPVKEADDKTLPTTAFLKAHAEDLVGDKFIRKDQDDETPHWVTFLKGLKIGKFITGMIGGRGAMIDSEGRGEMTSLTLREELIVPKITFNCIDVISGDKANTFAFGTIKKVDKKEQIAELDLLDGQIGSLHVNDICRGVFHNIEGGNEVDDDIEDANGFYQYAGFSTAYFTPTQILENKPGVFRFRYALQTGRTVHPMVGMNFFSYGNFTDKDRQSITYETRYYTRRLKNVNTWTINPTKNIAMQDGLIEGLNIGGMEMHGYGTFQENSYLTGVQIKFTPEQEDALKGDAAYNVALSDYSGTVVLDEEGNMVNGFTQPVDVVSGDRDVVSGERDVIAGKFRFRTMIQAFKGSKALIYSDAYGPGKYTVNLLTRGCSAEIQNGLVYITQIENKEAAAVDILVNCEGEVTFNQTYTLSFVREGRSPIVLNLSEDMKALPANPDGHVLLGVPFDVAVDAYSDGKHLSFNISDLSVTSVEGINLLMSSTPQGGAVIKVVEVADSVPSSVEMNISVKVPYAGDVYTKHASFRLVKVAQGKDAVMYELLPSSNVVKKYSDGKLSFSSVSCSVKKTTADKTEVLGSLDGTGLTMNYSIDKGVATPYGYAAGIDTVSFKESIIFRLFQNGNLIDNEVVPIVEDGDVPVFIDLSEEYINLACDSKGNVLLGQLPIVCDVKAIAGNALISANSLSVQAPTGVGVTTSAANDSISIDSVSANAASSLSLEVAATCNYGGKSHPCNAKIIINKVVPGENAVVDNLVLSASQIHIAKGTTTKAPALIQMSMKRVKGDTYQMITSPKSNRKVRISVDGNVEPALYDLGDSYSTAGITTKVKFELVDTDKNETIDSETIFVTRDGKDMVFVDLSEQYINLACDEDGSVLSNQLPIDCNVYAMAGNTQLTVEDITLDSSAGVTASCLGSVITIQNVTTDAPSNSSISATVLCTYEGVAYYRQATISINKVVPGENAVVDNLVLSSAQIHINEKGDTCSPTTITPTMKRARGKKCEVISTATAGRTVRVYKDGAFSQEVNLGTPCSVVDVTSNIKFELIDTSDSNKVIDTETVYVVKDGKNGSDGNDTIYLDLSEEYVNLSCDHNGTVLGDVSIPCVVKAMRGVSEISYQDLAVSAPSGVTYTQASDGFLITGISSSLGASIAIEVSANCLYKGKLYTRSAKMILNKVIPGKPGEKAVVDNLILNASFIHIDKNGNRTPSTITPSLKRTIGANSTTYTSSVSGRRVYVYKDGRYYTWLAIGEAGGTDGASSYIRYDLVDLNNNEQVLDSETIVIVKDGSDGKPGEDSTVPGEDGEPARSLVPSVSTIGRTVTGSYSPSSFVVNSYSGTSQESNSIFAWYKKRNDSSYYYMTGTGSSFSSSLTINLSPQIDYECIVVRMWYNHNSGTPSFSEGGYFASVTIPVVRDGSKGDPGPTGAMPRPCGMWHKGSYVYNSTYRDIVIHNGSIYQVKTYGTTVTSEPSYNNSDWEQADKYGFVATDTALIDKAHIAGFTFSDNKMKGGTNLSDPTLILDGINGVIKAKSGTIGGFTITSTGLVNNSNNANSMIEIGNYQMENTARVYFSVNSTQKYSGNYFMRAMSAQGIAFKAESFSGTAISVGCDPANGGTALNINGKVTSSCNKDGWQEIQGLVLKVRTIGTYSEKTVYPNDDVLVFTNTDNITMQMASKIPIGKVITCKLKTGSGVMFDETVYAGAGGALSGNHRYFRDQTTFQLVKIESSGWLCMMGW